MPIQHLYFYQDLILPSAEFKHVPPQQSFAVMNLYLAHAPLLHYSKVLGCEASIRTLVSAPHQISVLQSLLLTLNIE